MTDLYTETDLSNYLELINAVASLSNLFSDSNTPYINYRVVENVFCKVFNAENLSRSDIAFDAKIRNTGIGIKTFINHTGVKVEKIAEFNSYSFELRKLRGIDLASKLAELRNERIEFAKSAYNVTDCIYHCVTRTKEKLLIYNTNYDEINLEKLKIGNETNSSLNFKDSKNEYTFNFSKSTLFKKFKTPASFIELNVKILDNPFEILLEILKSKGLTFNKQLEVPGKDFVILPLYSTRLSSSIQKIVAERSGLNQWNAEGRPRDLGEVYIPIPKRIHKNFPNFFPQRKHKFKLTIPTGEIYDASICQQSGKALMADPNKALAKWMLRDVLKLDEGELLNYEKLRKVGVDSVIVTKIGTDKYKMDFATIGSYEDFGTLMPI